MKTILAIIGALSAASLAVPAQAQTAGNVLLDTFDGNALSPILIRMNAMWTNETTQDGEPAFLVTFANGAKASLVPTACENRALHSTCRALLIRANFAKSDRLTQQQLVEGVNRFNIGRPAGKATYYQDGTSRIELFIVGEGGIGSFNVQSQLTIFSQLIAVYSQSLYGAPAQ